MKCFLRKYELQLIVEQLRQYPLTEKLLICQNNATRLMDLTHLEILNTSNPIYPWELEVFAELSLFADAPTARCSFSNSDEAFINIINKIRNYQHPFLQKQKNIDFANAFMMVSGLQQFKVQENILDRLYRYNYFWNFVNDKINMPKIFSEHFNGMAYSEFRDLGLLVFFYASLKYPTAQIIRALISKYKTAVDFLRITREEYKQKQSEKIDDNFENVIFGFNYLRPYPFVECKEVLFLPLPYLIIDAVTESLLTRVTMDNNSLREKIGKEVAQTYIEEIFKEGNIYNEVVPECEYWIGKNKIDSPDISLRKGNQVCFIDTKLSTPKLEIRKFNSKAIDDTISKYAKNIIQMYNRIKDFNNASFYPFEDKLSIAKEDVFGVVALLEDSYISRRQIYPEVFKQIGISADSEEAKYIMSNIKITGFRDLEVFAFRSHDIFVALNKKKNHPEDWNDMGIFDSLLYKDDTYSVLPSVDDFTKKSKDLLMESIDELAALGIINKS